MYCSRSIENLSCHGSYKNNTYWETQNVRDPKFDYLSPVATEIFVEYFFCFGFLNYVQKTRNKHKSRGHNIMC